MSMYRDNANESAFLEGAVMQRTALAILLAIDGDSREVWIPLSQIVRGDDLEKGRYVEIEIAGWLAKEKGLS